MPPPLSWPDYVGDILCDHERKEPCVPLHEVATARGRCPVLAPAASTSRADPPPRVLVRKVAAACNSARLYSDIADAWVSEANKGKKSCHGAVLVMCTLAF